MFTCRQVSKSLAEGNYHDLPVFKKTLLCLHITLCALCHRSNGNIMVFHDMVYVFRRKEEELTDGPRLPDAVREFLRKSLTSNPERQGASLA